MLATGRVHSAQLVGNSVSLDKLSTLMDGQVQATITDSVVSANYFAAHQFGFAISTAGGSRFIVGNPSWDSVQCNCPLCLCYQIYPDTGIVWFYNNDGSFVSGYLPPT